MSFSLDAARIVEREERFQLDDDGAAVALREDEIDEAAEGGNLRDSSDAAHVAGERAENLLGGGFGFRVLREAFEIFRKRRVGDLGHIAGSNAAERERDALALREGAKGGEDFGGRHVGADV